MGASRLRAQDMPPDCLDSYDNESQTRAFPEHSAFRERKEQAQMYLQKHVQLGAGHSAHSTNTRYLNLQM